jgi:DNA-binding transcriptional LysR family regulator
MELRHLRYFIAVAEELHFGRAAARLHIAQPPLSQQIRHLEEELGVPLFTRTKRRVQLTEAGQVFLAEARQTLAQAEQAVRAAQRAHRGEIGRLAVGFVSSATAEVLPAILRMFRARFPEVELTLHELVTSQQVHALRQGRLQMGFLRPPVHDDALALETVLREPLVVLLPNTHDLASRRQIPLSALAHESFILPPHTPGFGLRDHVQQVCQAVGFSPRVSQEALQFQAIIGLVAAGLGISVVPASVRLLRQQGVVYRALQDQTPLREMAIAWRRDDTSSVLQAFLGVVRELKRAWSQASAR